MNPFPCLPLRAHTGPSIQGAPPIHVGGTSTRGGQGINTLKNMQTEIETQKGAMGLSYSEVGSVAQELAAQAESLIPDEPFTKITIV